MALERTLSIIKPDATARNLTGKINAKFEEGGLRIVAQKRMKLTQEQAEGFYAVHRARPFFRELVEFMCSGPVVVQVLEGENAIIRNREIMGRPIRPRPRRAQSARSSRARLAKTPCTVPTRLRPRKRKSPISSRLRKSRADL